MRGILFILIDFGFLFLAAYFAVVERGTFSGWCWAIACAAWTALIINAIISSYKG